MHKQLGLILTSNTNLVGSPGVVAVVVLVGVHVAVVLLVWLLVMLLLGRLLGQRVRRHSRLGLARAICRTLSFLLLRRTLLPKRWNIMLFLWLFFLMFLFFIFYLGHISQVADLYIYIRVSSISTIFLC